MITTDENLIRETASIKRAIKEHSGEEKPNECCGLIIQNIHGEIEIFKCKNSAEDKTNYFSIPPEEYLIASSIGQILAMYHSHTQGAPKFSKSDKAVSEGHKVDSILYHIETDQFLEYSPKCKRKKSK